MQTVILVIHLLIALALIGVICVGVSSWNLYVRWGKPD